MYLDPSTISTQLQGEVISFAWSKHTLIIDIQIPIADKCLYSRHQLSQIVSGRSANRPTIKVNIIACAVERHVHMIAPRKRDCNSVDNVAVPVHQYGSLLSDREVVAALWWPHTSVGDASYSLNQEMEHVGIAVPVRGRNVNVQPIPADLVVVDAIMDSLADFEFGLPVAGLTEVARVVESFLDVLAHILVRYVADVDCLGTHVYGNLARERISRRRHEADS
jgi:hypothetical protein